MFITRGMGREVFPHLALVNAAAFSCGEAPPTWKRGKHQAELFTAAESKLLLMVFEGSRALGHWFSELSGHCNSLKARLTTACRGSLQSFWLYRIGWSPRIYMSNIFQGDIDVDGPGMIL